MTVYARVGGKERLLSDEHRREIVEGSGVYEAFAEGRYFTVTEEEARALGFSEEQAGAGWAVELVSPSGEISYQLKRNQPRRDKHGNLIKYETPRGKDIVIDVHRRMRQRLWNVLPNTDKLCDIWITEGAKSGDSLSCRGYLTVVLTGVWNWGKKRNVGGVKYGRPHLLPDWDHVPLEGRRVNIVFDRDWREKPGVALAMLRLAERLTERGAKVYIISLPGPEKGIDDLIAAGGNVEPLIRGARPFQVPGLIPYAAKQDGRIHAAVEGILGRMRLDTLEDTTDSLLRAICEETLLTGKYDADLGEVVLVIDRRTLQERASIGSHHTLYRHLAKAEERGYIEKITGDRTKGEANRYILKFAEGAPGEGENIPNFSNGAPDEGATGTAETCGPKFAEGAPVIGKSLVVETPTSGAGLEKLVPHLRYPAPPAPENEPHRETASPSEPMRAPGKKLERAIDRLLAWGGSATLKDLAAATQVNDTSKMRKHLSVAASYGVIGIDEKGKHGARVWLCDGWQLALDKLQEESGGLARARRQAVKRRRDKEAFADPNRAKADKAPEENEMMGREKVRGVIEANREEWREKDAAEEAQSEVKRAADLITTTLAKPHIRERGCIRYGLMLEIWREDHGGRELDFKRAVKALGFPLKLHAEHQNNTFIYAMEESVAV